MGSVSPRGSVGLPVLAIWLSAALLTPACDGCGTQLSPAPLLTAVIPASVPAGSVTAVEVQGSSFTIDLSLSLGSGATETDETFELVLRGESQDYPMQSVTWRSATELDAEVPTGVPAGLYDLLLTDPKGSQASLEAALEVFVPGCTDAVSCGDNNPCTINERCEDGGCVYDWADLGGDEIIADGVDQDCDDVDLCWEDLDDDGYGSDLTAVDTDLDCDNDSAATASLGGDCDDAGACGADCFPGNPAPDDCDGWDNDCEGGADEDFVASVTSCGVGACAGNAGSLDCLAGVPVDSCDPLAGAAADDATCDDLDDDCDGIADDDYIDTPTTCGVGACAGNTGAVSCSGGIEADSCDPLAGAAADDATCDDVDDDCDGTPDDEWVHAPTTCGPGDCAAGLLECLGGVPTDSCAPVCGSYSVTIESLYPSFGVNWNDYVVNDGTDVYRANDVACDSVTDAGVGGPDNCIHGGEKRLATVSGAASCTDLTLRDALGVFEWICDDSGVGVEFYSSGFVPGKGLKDLILADAWRLNHVILTEVATDVATSPDAIWWGNTLTPLIDNAAGSVLALTTAGTIYTLASTRATAGYNIDADRIGVVTLPGATLQWNGSATFSCNDTTNEITSPTRLVVICAGAQSFLWVETDLEGPVVAGDGNGMRFANVTFSRIHGYSGNGSEDAHLVLELSTNNLITSSRIYNVTWTAFFIEASSDNAFRDVSAYDNTNIGLLLSLSSDRNDVTRAVVYNNGSADNIQISSSNANRLHDVLSHGGGTGVTVEGSSSNNLLTNITVAGASGNGIALGGNDNTIVGLYASGNDVGLEISGPNTASHVTSVNNASAGILIPNQGDQSTVNQAVLVNNGGFGLDLTGAVGGTLSQIAAAGNGADDGTSNITLGNGCDVAFTNILWLDGTSCDVAVNATGLTAACGLDGSSSHTLVVGADLGPSLRGKVLVDDPFNASDTDGSAAVGVITDWTTFGFAGRSWGNEGSAFPAADNRGPCAGSCRIWDWRLAPGDTVISDTSGDGINPNDAFIVGSACPSAVDGAYIVTDGASVPNTFLANAVEVFADGVGDEDGLCESNEACVYAPNFGAYQGDTDPLAGSCTFQGSTVTGVTMLRR